MQVTCAIVYCLFSAGIVFGFAALKPVLISEGIYSDACTADDPRLRFQSIASDPDYNPNQPTTACTEQELKLNKMFTIAAVATNLVALIIGNILDRFGPRVCGLIGALLIASGTILFLNSNSLKDKFDPYLISYTLLALGGPFAYISSFQLSNSFPTFSGTILALLTGAFDASSAIFLVFRIIYIKTNGEFNIIQFFKFYLIIPIFIIIVQLFIMPKESYKTYGDLMKIGEEGTEEEAEIEAVEEIFNDPIQRRSFSIAGGFKSNLKKKNSVNSVLQSESETESIDENSSLLPSALNQMSSQQRRDSIINGDYGIKPNKLLKHKAEEIINKKEAEISKISGVFGVLHGKTVSQQIKTPWFIFMLFFIPICMIRINYFVATIRSQYIYLLDDIDKAIAVNSYFDVALPLGGIIGIPFIGLLLDNFSMVTILSVLTTVSIVIGILGMINYSMLCAYLGITLLVVYRPFYYTVVSDYCGKVFGFDTFGSVYGIIICFAGLLNFIQTTMDWATHYVFNNNPTPINIITTTLTAIVGSGLILYIKTQLKYIERNRLEQEALNAPSSTLMPNVTFNSVDYQ